MNLVDYSNFDACRIKMWNLPENLKSNFLINVKLPSSEVVSNPGNFTILIGKLLLAIAFSLLHTFNSF